ncbi:MAG: lysophospholipid acyltransferase family protein [Deltaproteobacteria bacterium]|nr:lysophospholipid acyltransferase family protein [Deltaproteobacteria bacterium]
MIPDAWFRWAFALYARRLLARHAAIVRRRGVLPKRGERVLYLVNHSSWWDALVVVLLSREIGGDQLALMGEAGLRQFPFFGRLGALSVPASRGPREVLRLFRQVRARVDAGAQVWMFPQGEQRHPDVQPLGFERGADVLARTLAPCRVVPIALRWETWRWQHPELLVSIGEPLEVAGDLKPGALEELLAREVSTLRSDCIAQRTDNFATWIRGRSSVSDVWLAAKSTVQERG